MNAERIKATYACVSRLLEELRTARPERVVAIDAELLQLRKGLEELSLDPDLPLPALVTELLHGRGWENPALLLHLLENPCLTCHVPPKDLLRGLAHHLNLPNPFDREPTRGLGHPERYGKWEPLARALFRSWKTKRPE